ncbi:hypothetical protein QBC44DRAFT_394298 [Cladorrhinum sp. PSN332]|nr:hypothetical protein QBC44DRAFT_394298 [Cladorrhinum sp. PSN332]
MLLRTTLVAIALLFPGQALAQDGPIDWSKAPGGVPYSYLRACAHWAFSPGWEGSVQNNLGCTVNSCLCRSDLIKRAQDRITKVVTDECSKGATDPTVDVEQALKVYNDYCSVHGFNVPGWTYVRTQTVKVTTVPATPGPSTEIPVTTTSSPLTSTANSTTAGAGGAGTAVITSAPGNGPGGRGGGQEVVTAVVTVTRAASSSAGRRSHIPLIWVPFHLSCKSVIRLGSLLSTMPKRLMSAFGETTVVVVTQSPPAPGITSVFIKSLVETQGVPMSTHIVTQVVGGSGSSNLGESTGGNVDETPADGGSSNTKTDDGSDGEKSLSKLEVVGIVLGIIFGLITTVATVWVCVRQGVVRLR